ncbi:hypothetical protein BKP45_07090 [Anaerobacillus alkalidiazotrophicus]|uniref:PsbP C-terminal domain-containing protein n=1 Tax=Anaerobacillus alkalidiazotrophicus TaxID=472963 RepID=A0A1S2MCU6_9BACI|nr:hypothetical protein [Anaerobacillus alkalidiazotrophicus]OIJ22394.1 hypothetical protein BKP45_07090 [Anaerobacillus alkalidiazotrophicus]
MRSKVILVLFFTLLLLGACGTDSSQSNLEKNTEPYQTEELNYLYESQLFIVADTPGWTVHQENTSNDKANVMFQNGKLRAIVTVVSNEKSLEEIKKELKASFRNVEEIEETNNYLSFKSKREESIRTEIYLHSGDGQTGILIFMTPLNDYETNQSKIIEFKNNVQYF